jgi:Gpi18-like mannosyltransferase
MRFLRLPLLQCSVLMLLTLVLRVASASGPYFVDAPRHISAIESGKLVIHTPGYFLFNLSGFILSHLLHVSAGSALHILNVAFSVAGAAVFYLLVSRLFPGSSPFWLSLAYICSPIVWFSADIHSSYAAMTFFAPLLILLLELDGRFVWGCVVWALMTGYRPSDGVFVLPWMLFHSLHFPWKQRLAGAFAAIAIVAAWWVSTAQRYGGSLLLPLSSSRQQVHGLAQGILTGHLGVHAAVNAVHALAGIIMTWGLLTPAVTLGATAWKRSAIARSMTIFLAPGLAFFLLYYFSDGPYLAYTAAAGMVLAGVYLANRPAVTQRTIYAVAICASVLFMVLARPANGKSSKLRAVTDAYFVRYSVPSLKQQSDPRLAKLLGACHDQTVVGVCK